MFNPNLQKSKSIMYVFLFWQHMRVFNNANNILIVVNVIGHIRHDFWKYLEHVLSIILCDKLMNYDSIMFFTTLKWFVC